MLCYVMLCDVMLCYVIDWTGLDWNRVVCEMIYIWNVLMFSYNLI
jgi:hypothetical protein